MMKATVVGLFALFFAIPALAKSNRDIYPVSCDDLWTAVKDTLGKPSDYGVQMMDDAGMTASFVVVGALTVYTDKVALTARENGCQMKLAITQVGSDNADERGFRKRLARSLAKVQAMKPAKPPSPVATAPSGH